MKNFVHISHGATELGIAVIGIDSSSPPTIIVFFFLRHCMALRSVWLFSKIPLNLLEPIRHRYQCEEQSKLVIPHNHGGLCSLIRNKQVRSRL